MFADQREHEITVNIRQTVFGFFEYNTLQSEIPYRQTKAKQYEKPQVRTHPFFSIFCRFQKQIKKKEQKKIYLRKSGIEFDV